MGDWLPEQNLPFLRQEEQVFWLEAILPGMMVHALKKKTGTGYHLANTGYHLFTPTPLTVHDGDSWLIQPLFFPVWKSFRSSEHVEVLAPRLKAINSSCAVSYPRSKNRACSASYLYKWKSSANLSLSLGFNRCHQNKVDVLGLAQNRTIINSSLRLSKDFLVTQQGKTGITSPLYGLLLFSVLWACSQKVSRQQPSDTFQLLVIQMFKYSSIGNIFFKKKPNFWNLQIKN